MAKQFTMNVPAGLDLKALTKKLGSEFEANGYTVAANSNGAIESVTFEKKNSKMYKFLALDNKITANCSINGNVLNVDYTDVSLTWKIAAIIVGLVAPVIINSVIGLVAGTIAGLIAAVLAMIPVLGWILDILLLVLIAIPPILVGVAGLALIVTAIIGLCTQCSLPKKIQESMTVLVNSANVGNTAVAPAVQEAPKTVAEPEVKNVVTEPEKVEAEEESTPVEKLEVKEEPIEKIEVEKECAPVEKAEVKEESPAPEKKEKQNSAFKTASSL